MHEFNREVTVTRLDEPGPSCKCCRTSSGQELWWTSIVSSWTVRSPLSTLEYHSLSVYGFVFGLQTAWNMTESSQSPRWACLIIICERFFFFFFFSVGDKKDFQHLKGSLSWKEKKEQTEQMQRPNRASVGTRNQQLPPQQIHFSTLHHSGKRFSHSEEQQGI